MYTNHLVSQYWAFFTFFVIALSLCSIMLFLGWILGGKSKSRNKHTPFESGIAPTNFSNLRFSVHFYLVAIYFVLFDIEALYLYIWSVSIIECGWLGFIEIFFFIFSLLSGLVYLISCGSLNWNVSKKNCVI